MASIAAAVSLCAAGAAGAQEAQATPDVVFEPVENYVKGQIKVVGGEKIEPKDWKALVITKVGEDLDQAGNKVDRTCTASLVGEGVVLTAAHCIDVESVTVTALDRTVGIRLKNNQMILLQCRVPEKYAASPWANRTPRNAFDWALCRYASPGNNPPELQNLRYEVLDLRTLQKPDPALITGFGCKELRFNAQGQLIGALSDDVLTIANATVHKAAIEAGGYVEFRAPWESSPALCPGDSGGPLLADATVKDFKKRRITAINSAVYPDVDVDGSYDIVSQVAPLSAPEFRTYLKEWLAANTDRAICGAPGASGGYPCRD